MGAPGGTWYQKCLQNKTGSSAPGASVNKLHIPRAPVFFMMTVFTIIWVTHQCATHHTPKMTNTPHKFPTTRPLPTSHPDFGWRKNLMPHPIWPHSPKGHWMVFPIHPCIQSSSAMLTPSPWLNCSTGLLSSGFHPSHPWGWLLFLQIPQSWHLHTSSWKPTLTTPWNSHTCPHVFLCMVLVSFLPHKGKTPFLFCSRKVRNLYFVHWYIPTPRAIPGPYPALRGKKTYCWINFEKDLQPKYLLRKYWIQALSVSHAFSHLILTMFSKYSKI